MEHKTTKWVLTIFDFIQENNYDFYLSDVKDKLQEECDKTPSDSTLYRILKQFEEEEYIWRWENGKIWKIND